MLWNYLLFLEYFAKSYCCSSSKWTSLTVAAELHVLALPLEEVTNPPPILVTALIPLIRLPPSMVTWDSLARAWDSPDNRPSAARVPFLSKLIYKKGQKWIVTALSHLIHAGIFIIALQSIKALYLISIKKHKAILKEIYVQCIQSIQTPSLSSNVVMLQPYSKII